MATEANNTFDLHKKVLIVGVYEVPQSIPPCCLLYQLGEEILLDGPQESSGLLMPCCAVSPEDIKVVEEPHEDQSCSYLSLEVLIPLYFPVRQPGADFTFLL